MAAEVRPHLPVPAWSRTEEIATMDPLKFRVLHRDLYRNKQKLASITGVMDARETQLQTAALYATAENQRITRLRHQEEATIELQRQNAKLVERLCAVMRDSSMRPKLAQAPKPPISAPSGFRHRTLNANWRRKVAQQIDRDNCFFLDRLTQVKTNILNRAELKERYKAHRALVELSRKHARRGIDVNSMPPPPPIGQHVPRLGLASRSHLYQHCAKDLPGALMPEGAAPVEATNDQTSEDKERHRAVVTPPPDDGKERHRRVEHRALDSARSNRGPNRSAVTPRSGGGRRQRDQEQVDRRRSGQLERKADAEKPTSAEERAAKQVVRKLVAKSAAKTAAGKEASQKDREINKSGSHKVLADLVMDAAASAQESILQALPSDDEASKPPTAEGNVAKQVAGGDVVKEEDPEKKASKPPTAEGNVAKQVAGGDVVNEADPEKKASKLSPAEGNLAKHDVSGDVVKEKEPTKKALQQDLFSQVDTNGDGHIDRNELAAYQAAAAADRDAAVVCKAVAGHEDSAAAIDAAARREAASKAGSQSGDYEFEYQEDPDAPHEARGSSCQSGVYEFEYQEDPDAPNKEAKDNDESENENENDQPYSDDASFPDEFEGEGQKLDEQPERLVDWNDLKFEGEQEGDDRYDRKEYSDDYEDEDEFEEESQYLEQLRERRMQEDHEERHQEEYFDDGSDDQYDEDEAFENRSGSSAARPDRPAQDVDEDDDSNNGEDRGSSQSHTFESED